MIGVAQLAAHGDAPALLDDERASWLDYRSLAQAVGDGADRLAGLPTRPLVFLFTRDRVVDCIAYLGCREAGAVVGLFEAGLPAGRAAALIERYRPHLVMGFAPPAGYADTAEGWFRRLADDGPALHPNLAVLLSTSGSTGSPKLVRLSRAAVDANAAAIIDALGIAPDQRSLLNLPFSYSYGLSVLNSHLAAGASLLLTRQAMTAPGFWQRLAETRVTSMPGVPTSYGILRRLGFEELAPPSLRILTQAGGKLAPPLIGHFHQATTARGGKFFVMYGATEATARMAVLDPALLPGKLGAVGRAVPGGHFEIVPGALGDEVVYHGPNVMMGYAESPEDLALGDQLGGRLATGDLGRLDEDGVLWITGRAKRIAKVNGLRLNLDEVEALAVARFAPAAALAEDDRLTLLIEADESRATELRRELALALALPPASLRLRCVRHLPLSANGKIDRDAVGRLVA
jgi:acyl-coenzyme A synthetase/AMP-(fatty) acid ligase